MADETQGTSQGNAVLLARIDERTQNTERGVQEIRVMVEKNYVTQQEFKPIKSFVYGVVALMVAAIIGGLIALVIKN